LLALDANAERFLHLAREFRARHRLWMGGATQGFGRLSPSAELMVDPQSGARCAIRDTGAPEAECYFWTVTVFGYHQLAAGRTPELAEARSQAEAGVVDYTAAWREMSRDGSGDYGWWTLATAFLAAGSLTG
jgi:inosine-uridine nucleoside N-ribohydrolase